MRRILLAATALVAFSTVAVAADMPVKAPAYAAPAPMFNWTGFYIGGNVGAAWENLTTTDVDGFAALATPGTRTKLHDTGFIGGGQLGYNFQSGNWLVGIEGDIGWLDLGKKRFITGTTSSTQVGIDSGLYADVTGRIGYITNNNALWYAKGGWAYYNGDRLFSTTAGFTAGNIGSFSGWTAGGGVEWLIGPNWTAKIEYQHFDFGTERFALTPPTFRFDEKLRVDVVKVGLNWKFGN